MNKDSFTSSALIFIAFVSFSCFHALARALGTMLTRSVESRHSCFIQYFSTTYDAHCRFSVRILYQIDELYSFLVC